ncbi:MAG: Ig-like domain-containing protein [Candidatus Omnitrophica bacterium]|nr:Ig-like domain-containing protein [Candidatus Omnitrophota bacterium]
MERQPEVLYAEPNYRLHISQSTPKVYPNDFEFAKQLALENAGQSGGTADDDLHMPEAWAMGTGDPGVKVAVIDTGIDYFHPDLESNVWTNPGEIPGNGIDDDGNGYIDDVHGYDFVSDDGDPMDDQSHGTHVSGIIGAVGDNKIGVTGICWRVNLMALKAFDENGDAALSVVLDAIHYAIANGARIINASWGETDPSQSLHEAIQEAHQGGLIIIAAAGNQRSEISDYPAAYDEVIGVAATTALDQRANFSNYGPQVALAAPGDNIYSTLPNAKYGYLSGTSMAAPQVTGVAALVLARHPEFSNVEVEDILRNAVDPIPSSQMLGSGRLNARKAVQVETPLPNARLTLPQVVFGRLDIKGTASGPGFADYQLAYGTDFYTTNWTEFYAGSTPVTNGDLCVGFDTTGLAEGTLALRLTVRDTLGQTATDRAMVTVRNIYIASPMNNDVLRAGDSITIRGTVAGPGRSYTVEHGRGWQPSTWSGDDITLAHGSGEEVLDGILATWDTRSAPANEFYALRLTVRQGDHVIGEWKTQLLYLDGSLRPGWPQYIPMGTEYVTNDWRDVTVADLDGDGFKELIRVDPGNSEGKPAELMVYSYDGNLRWSRELGTGEPYSDIPVVGDVDGDGFGEIFTDVGEQHELEAFRYDGTPLGANWPVHLEAANLGKVLADLDGDGRLELIGYAQDPVATGGVEHRQLVVFDSTGTLLRKWTLGSGSTIVDVPKMLPAVGNLDDDPDLEIVAVFDSNHLAMFDLKNPGGPIWTAPTEGALLGSPVIGDILGNGENQILIGAYDTRPRAKGGTHGGIYLFSRDGQCLPGWPVLNDESFTAAPALADMDGDGRLEIAIPSLTSQKLHLLRSDGFEVSGWPKGPFDRTTIRSSPVIGDVNGDGLPDVVIVTPGQLGPVATSGDLSSVGGIAAWDFHGQPIDLNPNPSLSLIVMESAGGSRLKAFPITLTDLDNNGKLDLVASTIEDRAFSSEGIATRKNRYSIYAWELNTPFAATNEAWPAFQRNARHTGYYEPPPHVNQPPVVRGIPNQTAQTGTPFFPIELDRYVEDPDNTPAEIQWSIEGNTQLQVAISPEHVATVLPLNPGWSGQETIRFMARDPGGLEADQSVVFAAGPDFHPPIASPDEAITREDTPVEIDVLANDLDPGGLPMAVVAVSKPLTGMVRITSSGTLLYTPSPNFNGVDSFSYSVSNGQVGMAKVTVRVLPVQDPPVAVADHAITDEDTPLSIDILENDYDPDGDRLELVSFEQPQNGFVSMTADSKLLYSPRTNYYGMDSFTYQIADGFGGISSAAVAIIVKPVNDPPVALDQSFTINRNTKQDVVFQGADADGDELTFEVDQGPEHGELWNYPKLATYIPNKGYAGPDQFTYRASDGEIKSQAATVKLTVLDANNPPEPDPQAVRTKVDQPLDITLTATDLDDDPVSFSIVTPPSHGSLEGHQTNYTYTPAPGFMGPDEFTFRADDDHGGHAEAKVSITVTDQNTAPDATDSSVSLRMNTSTNFTLEASDPEGDPLTFLVLTNPANGSLTGDPPELIYTPVRDYVGPDRLTFKVSDGQLESGVGTVTINVLQPNLPPETSNQSFYLVAGESAPVALRVTDPDGDPMRCAILKGPSNGRLAGVGTNYTYNPAPGFVGSDSFTYKAWDGQAYSQVATVTVYVSAQIDLPELSFVSVNRLVNGNVSLTLNVQPGRGLLIESSTDLVNWSTLTTYIPSGQTATFVDTNTPGLPECFYRASQR